VLHRQESFVNYRVTVGQAILKSGGLGLRYGAVAGAICGTVVPIIGNIIGCVLGAIGGFVAGVISSMLGGVAGCVIGGFVGGMVILPQLNPFSVYYGGDPPQYFWQAVLYCIPSWIGAAVGLGIGIQIYKDKSRWPGINQLRETVSDSLQVERYTLPRWLLRLPAIIFIALGFWLCIEYSDYPKHQLTEYHALQHLSEEMQKHPKAKFYSVEGLEYHVEKRTLKQVGKKGLWRNVRPEAIHKVSKLPDGHLGTLTTYGAVSPPLAYDAHIDAAK
jgi:hypothetical protein